MNRVEIKIVNVIATCVLPTTVDLELLARMFPESVKLNAKYPKYKCAYIKLNDMKGKLVTVFQSGRMISVGAKSVEDAEKDLTLAYSFILKASTDLPRKYIYL